MLKKFKKEIIAIASGMAVAYFWQLFAILMCYISDPSENFITRATFIPETTIQVAIMPMVSWALMGFLRVTWFKKWLRITTCGLAFLIPFTLIAALTVIILPTLWWEPMYWVVNAALSVLLAFTFKSFLKLSYSDMEQNLPKGDEKK